MSVPNYVHIGMLGCYEELTSAMPQDIKAFVESQSADENGVIVVAFGTVVARSKVYHYIYKFRTIDFQTSVLF